MAVERSAVGGPSLNDLQQGGTNPKEHQQQSQQTLQGNEDPFLAHGAWKKDIRCIKEKRKNVYRKDKSRIKLSTPGPVSKGNKSFKRNIACHFPDIKRSLFSLVIQSSEVHDLFASSGMSQHILM